MKTKLYSLIVLIIFSLTVTSAQETEKIKVEYTPSNEENAFLDKVQALSFQYFVKEANFQNGLVKDRSTETSPASIAATGFAIPIWALGSEKGWMSRDSAAQITLNLFRFLHNSE